MNKERNRMYKNVKSFFGVIALFASIFLISSCSNAVEERVETVGGVTAQQIIDNPEAYVGRTVTVSGDVEEIFEPRAFNIDSGSTIGELLVIGREPFPQVTATPNRAILKGDIATVTGVVKMLTSVEDVEREIGWDLTPQIVTTYQTKPVLIAQTSSFRAGVAVNNTKTINDINANVDIDENTNTTVDKTLVDPPVSDADIVSFSDYEKAVDRKSYVGKRVRLQGINVESVVGDRAFFVGTSPTKRILIVFEEEATPNTPIEGKVDIDKGQKVTIDGIVRAMPSVEEAKRRFGHLMTAETLNNLKNETTYIYTDDPKIVQGAK